MKIVKQVYKAEKKIEDKILLEIKETVQKVETNKTICQNFSVYILQENMKTQIYIKHRTPLTHRNRLKLTTSVNSAIRVTSAETDTFLISVRV